MGVRASPLAQACPQSFHVVRQGFNPPEKSPRTRRTWRLAPLSLTLTLSLRERESNSHRPMRGVGDNGFWRLMALIPHPNPPPKGEGIKLPLPTGRGDGGEAFSSH